MGFKSNNELWQALLQEMTTHKTEWPKTNSTALLVRALNEALLKLEKCEAPPQPCPAQFGALEIAQTLLAIVVFIVVC